MIKDMERVRMTEAEVANNFAAVLEKLKHGAEVVVEQGYRPVAVISPVKGPGRPIDECIALAKAHGSGAELDEEYAADLEEIIARRAARIDGESRRRGVVIPFQDLVIGVTALEFDYAVATANVRHFQMIPGLVVKQL